MIRTGHPVDSVIHLHPTDNVAIIRTAVGAGDCVWNGSESQLFSTGAIDRGHKVAIEAIAAGEAIRKYGQVIGFASRDISAGEWVHLQNVDPGELSLDRSFSSEVPDDPIRAAQRTFRGYRRANGSVGTRNYVAVLSTVNCSATTARYVAQQLTATDLAGYEHIDGVVPFVHKGGCAFEYGGADHRQLSRTIAGFARHPNIGAVIILGLGCETAQAGFVEKEHQLVQLQHSGSKDASLPLVLNIQDEGGIRRTVDRATGVLRDLLPEANRVAREEISAAELIVGLECGGSDGASGITANPAVGVAADLMVAQGGTAILAEVPEMYGAEHLLTRRARTPDVAQKLMDRIHWWEDYAARHGARIDNNPSYGNKQGGLTTLYEKSLGAVAKGGSTALNAVYEYAEPVTEKGLVIMDTPGYDPASVTGMVAGGAQVVIFTTGRGSCFGCKPSPTIKVATNTPMFRRMETDMDVNAGTIMDGDAGVEDVGREIFDMILDVASGKQTRSEAQGVGDEEFCPWVPGPIF